MSILPQEVPQPVLANWAAGHDGHGHAVRGDIKLAAQLRLAATDDGTDDKPFSGGEDGWDESDWDDVRAHLESESPWFKRVLAGESPGDPDEDPSTTLPTKKQVADSMQGALVKFTPHTAEASTVHKPTVPPGGPGLFHMKGHQLPPYVQHLYRHLVGKYGKHRAYGVAIGIVKKWASGVNPGGKGKGHKVHADVQAAAAKNVGEWEKEKAEAHAHHKGKSDHAKATASSLDKVVALAASNVSLARPYVRFERGREEQVRGYIGRNLRGDRQLDSVARPAAAAFHERFSAETRAKAAELYHRLPPGMQQELAHFAHAPLTVKVRAALGAAKNLHDMQDALPKWYGYVFKYGSLITIFSPLPGDEALPYIVVAAGVLAKHRRLLHVAWHGAQMETGDYEVARAAHEAQAYADHLLMRGPEDMAPIHETDNPFTALAAPAANPSGQPYRRSFLPPIGPSDLKQGSITNPGVVSAPGAKPQRVPFGNPVMQHAPSQTVAAGPPLPPAVSLPTSKEITALISQVPAEPDPTLANGIKKHLTAAARKASLGDNIGALAAMRSVQTGVHAGYRAAVMANAPNEAAVFSAAGFAGKVDNPDAVKARDSGRQLILNYRQLHKDVAAHIDRFRRTYFHGQYNNTAELRMAHPLHSLRYFNPSHMPDEEVAAGLRDGNYGGFVENAQTGQLKWLAEHHEDPQVRHAAANVLDAKKAGVRGYVDLEAYNLQHLASAKDYETPGRVRGGMVGGRDLYEGLPDNLRSGAYEPGSSLERVKAHERRVNGREEYVRETYRHVDPAKVGLQKFSSSGPHYERTTGAEVYALDRDRSTAPVWYNSLTFGRVERHGLMWHGIHNDGTDTGPKADKHLAVGALVDYHNQRAAEHPYDPEKTAQLEKEAGIGSNSLEEEIAKAAGDKDHMSPQDLSDHDLNNQLHKAWKANGRSHYGITSDRHGALLDEWNKRVLAYRDGTGYEGLPEDRQKAFGGHLTDGNAREDGWRERYFAANPDADEGLSAGTDRGALQLTRGVRSYTRLEKGHLETVKAYNRQDSGQMALHLKYLNRLFGSGKKYTPGQGFFIDSKGEKHWGWHGAAGLLVQHTDEQGVTRYLLQRRTGSVQHGGTWSTPGGAIDNNKATGKVETPEEAAFREGGEEFGPEFQNRVMHMKVVGRDTQGFGTPGTVGYWAYHTIRVATPDRFDPTKGKKGKDSWEAGGFKWVTPKEMAKLPLHPGFRDTALKLGMPDVPNPKPYSDGYSSYTYSGGSSLANDQESDYKKDQRVTWKHGKEIMHGVVTGPGKNMTTKDVKGGASLPEGYMVKGDKGFEGEVKWGQLRLETPRKPAATFPAGTSKSYETKQPQAPAAPKPSGVATPGPVPAIAPTATVAKSRQTPGMQVQVPAAVTAVYEHPHGDQLIIQVGGKYYAYEHGKIKYEAKQPKAPWGKMDLQAPGGPSTAPATAAPAATGTGFASKVTSAVKGQKGAKVTTKDDGAQDPYFASQAKAAGLDPYSKKLPPGPVMPKVADRKLFDTVHSENQRTAAADQKKNGSRNRTGRSGLPRLAPATRSYAPHRLRGNLTRPSDASVPLPPGHPGLRKPKAPGARKYLGGM